VLSDAWVRSNSSRVDGTYHFFVRNRYPEILPGSNVIHVQKQNFEEAQKDSGKFLFSVHLTP
jgi:hypothetical protein